MKYYKVFTPKTSKFGSTELHRLSLRDAVKVSLQWEDAFIREDDPEWQF